MNWSVLPWCGVADSSKQVGRRFGQCCSELVAGNLLGAAAHAVGFVDDDQIP